MSVKVVVRDGETIQEAVRRFRTICRQSGVLTGHYIRLADRNRQRYYFESKGVKQRRRRHIADARRRSGS
jgi:ribosomal protein S21